MERRAQRKAEREARRALRLKKRMTHESVMANGTPKVQPDDSRFGLREALTYSPLMFCEACNRIVRESEMAGDICEFCYYEYGERRSDRISPKKEHGDTPKGGFPYSPPMGQQGNLYEGEKT